MSATPDASRAAATDGTVLAFDFGTHKIGVALGNTITRTARPLATLREATSERRLAALGTVIAQWQPVVLVVGRPLHADGTPHAMTARAERFARQLTGRFGITVAQVDERYTTQLADTMIRGAAFDARGGPGRDAFAAQLILEAWLQDQNNNIPR